MEPITFEKLPEAFTHLFNKVENIERLLLQKAEPDLGGDKVLTIREAAEILKLSVPTLYGLVSRSQIPVSKKGKRLYFSRDELMSWIKSGRKSTTAEMESEAAAFVIKQNKR